MTGFGKLGRWQKAMLVATSVGVLGASFAAPLAEAAFLRPVSPQRTAMAQNDSEPGPSQVNEGQGDAETLDAGAPPAQTTQAVDDDDIELLDQGSPPPSVTTAPVPVTDGTMTTSAPVAGSAPAGTAYHEPAGPWLPPGFGEGRVLVSNSPRGIPVGLEPCKVGVVTGRAYVGIKCGDDRTSAVGHASSFEDFPFAIDPGFPFEPGAAVVTDPSFPFDEDSPFFESALDRTTDSDVVVLVAPRGFPFDDADESGETDGPTIVRGDVVSMAQPARAGKERARERTRITGSASSGDVSSNPGKSRTRRSATKKQRAVVGSESRQKNNSQAKKGNKSKKNKNNKKNDRKKAGKESKKQTKAEKREKRQRTR